MALAKQIRLPCFGIVIRLDVAHGVQHLPAEDSGKNFQVRPTTGTIVSDLHEPGRGRMVRQFNAAIDALEAMILAHACVGIDVASPAYVEGIETAVEAIGNALS